MHVWELSGSGSKPMHPRKEGQVASNAKRNEPDDDAGKDGNADADERSKRRDEYADGSRARNGYGDGNVKTR